MLEDQLNKLLTEIQDHSLNTGGIFNAYIIDKENSSVDCLSTLKKELLKVPRYADPASDGRYFESRDLEFLQLKEIQNWEEEIQNDIQHWVNFELINDSSKEQYNQEVIDLKQAELVAKIKSVKQPFKVFISEGKFDVDFAPWADHINKDIYFDFEDQVLIVHFGWSS
ncbi:MAG: hypothetical protein MI810_19215 [Flavobacteriales bacterium]|nr:hypothetical protein [Flavobacteriales bacterium]